MKSRDAVSGDQLRVLRGLTPAQRYKAGRQLYWTLRKHKRAFLESVHPEWSNARIDRELRRIFLGAGT